MSLRGAERRSNLHRPGRTRPTSARLKRLPLDLLVVAGGFIIGLPLALTLYLSFFNEKLVTFPPRGYTLAWYSRTFTEFGGPFAFSAELAALAVAGSLLIGVPAGIALSRYRNRTTATIGTILLAPIAFPGIALSLAIFVYLVLIEQVTTLAFVGFGGLLAAHLLITTPWVVRLCVASLANHDRTAEEAATSLGASPAMVIWRVTLPAMRAGIVAAALFAFIISFDNLEMALFLSAPGMTTLPVSILEYLEYHIDPLVAAIAVVQIVGIGGLLLVLDRFVRLTAVAR